MLLVWIKKKWIPNKKVDEYFFQRTLKIINKYSKIKELEADFKAASSVN